MVTQVMSTFQKPFRRGHQVAANLCGATPLRNQEVGGDDRAFRLAVPFVKHVAEPAGAVAYTAHVVNDQEILADVVLHLPFVSRGIVEFSRNRSFMAFSSMKKVRYPARTARFPRTTASRLLPRPVGPFR